MNCALTARVVIALSPWNRTRWFFFLCAILAVATGVAQGTGEQLPSFKVTGQHMTNLAVLVPKDTPNEQLKTLVLALRKARRENRLGELLPPTTPRGSRGPHGIAVVYVYSEPEWATTDALRKCVNASANTPLYKECGRHVRAYYFYAAQPENEEGSVGYAEGKQVFTKSYQKLF
jgi:hypothetical protein